MPAEARYQNPSIFPGKDNPIYSPAFSANPNDIINMGFLRLNQANLFSANPDIQEKIKHHIYKPLGILSFLEEMMGTKYTCKDSYQLAHYFASKRFLNLANVAAINVPASTAGTNYVDVTWPIAQTSMAGTFLLPQIGGALSVAPLGQFLEVTSITPAAGTFTVRLTNKKHPAFVIPALSDVVVLSGKELADCQCPSGTSIFEDGPLLETIKMFDLGGGTSPICKDALLTCQNMLFEYQATDDEGCLKTFQYWFDAAYLEMVASHRRRKLHEILLNADFGIIPKIRTHAYKWTWADVNNIALSDIEFLAISLLNDGINTTEFMLYLEPNAYASVQRLANTLGLQRVMYGSFNPNECKSLNMQFCSITHMGLTLTFKMEGIFTDKNYLGGAGFAYKSKGFGIPMGDRMNREGEGECSSTNKKHITLVKFQDIHGKIWDDEIDSNGYLNTKNENEPPSRGNNWKKNTKGTGCVEHEYTIESRFTVELHELYCFLWIN